MTDGKLECPGRDKFRGRNTTHCILPVEYDFFVDYKAVRMHWVSLQERVEDEKKKSITHADTVKFLWESYGTGPGNGAGGESVGGVKILHWPGELRKPWQRYVEPSRSTYDWLWWSYHDKECQRGPCRMKCELLR
jgi:hypothetical protein